MFKSLLLFHIDHSFIGHSIFFGSYGTVLASWLHWLPMIFGWIGAITGGLVGIIMLVAKLWETGGIKGLLHKFHYIWRGNERIPPKDK